MASDMENEEEIKEQPEEIATPQWYILKVQVNREDRVKRELDRRVKLAGLTETVKETLVPVERVVEIKNGRKRETKRKRYPGYIMVNMVLTDEAWFLLRETPGVGEFIGTFGKPLPMTQKDVELMLQSDVEASVEKPRLEIPYRVGDRVKIKEGTFEDVEGVVAEIDELTGNVKVNIVFFNQDTPVELEYWQVEKVEA